MGILDKYKEDKELLELYNFDGTQSKLGLYIEVDEGKITFADGDVECERYCLYVCALELVDDEWEHCENIECVDEFLLYEDEIILNDELLNEELGEEEDHYWDGAWSRVLESYNEWSAHKSQYIKMKSIDEIEIC